MARDYKRNASRRKKKTNVSPWSFLVSGFALGLIAALALYLYVRPTPLDVPDRPIPDARTTPQSSEDELATADSPTVTPAPAEATPVTPAHSAPATTAPAAEQSSYDFYDVLPDFEMVVAEDEKPPSQAKPATIKRPTAATGAPSKYILQAGSFRKFIDADRRKAELAFKGIESNIQQVVLKEDQIWFRVYVGPGDNLAQFESMRSDLRRANIDVLILKVR
ncbi:MAG: SPOR domain-containing protein [Pseudomonadota bacterium]